MNFTSIFYLCVLILGGKAAGQVSDDVSELLYTTELVLDHSIKTSYGGYVLSTAGSGHKDSSKVFETKMDVEKAIHRAQSSPFNRRFTEKRLKDLVNSIKVAVDNGKYRFARWATGTGMHGAIKSVARKSHRRKRSSSSIMETFLIDVKGKIGLKEYRKMMRLDEHATLMFAIDTTGSMHQEIKASQSIAQAIVNWPREHNLTVNYRLCPFNDPDVGPAITRGNHKGQLFAEDIGSLFASGGGDCPEPSFAAMCKTFMNGSDVVPGSPFFVFTDASPKEIDEIGDKETVIDLAQERSASVTFFVSKEKWGKCNIEDYTAYNDIAYATDGHVFHLPSTEYIKQMKGLAAASLKDFVLLCSVKHHLKRMKRSPTTSFAETFIVDGPFDDIIVTIDTWQRSSITLTNPGNDTITGDTVFDRGAVYIVPNPLPGVYKLLVSSMSATDVRYTVKASSPTKIEFSSSFVLPPQRLITLKETPIQHPLSGRKAFARIAVEGASLVNQSAPLVMKLVNEAGVPINVQVNFTKVRSNAGSKRHYTATFNSPSISFRLQLSGQTKQGIPFQRVGKNGLIKAKPAVVRLVPGRDDGRLTLGKRSRLLFKIFNAGRSEAFVINIKDSLGFLRVTMTKFTLQNTQRSILVSIKPTRGKRGKINKIKIEARGKSSGVFCEAFETFQLF